MRILFCNYEHPPLGGGGGVFSASLARELADQHQIVILTSSDQGLPLREMQHGYEVCRVPVPARIHTSVAALPAMAAYVHGGRKLGRQLLREYDFDLIHTFFAVPSGPVGDYLARRYRVPHIISVLGGDIYDPSKFLSPHRHFVLRRLIKGMLNRSDLVVGESADIIDRMQQYYRPHCRTDLIPLGIDRPQFAFDPSDDLQLDAGVIKLVTVGRLVRRKQVARLLECLSRLPERAHLIVIGSGPEEENLKSAAAALGVADRTHFLGYVSNERKEALLEGAHVFVSTSEHEGFGLVFIEAMAHGLPVVCFDRGGQTDFMIEDETGYVVNLNDLDAFAARCRRLIDDAQLRETISANNRKHAESFYVDGAARKYSDWYASLARAPGAAGAPGTQIAGQRSPR